MRRRPDPVTMEIVEPHTIDFAILLAFVRTGEKGLRPGEIASMLSVKHSTVNSAIRRMEKRGLVRWQHYGDVELEPAGKEQASHLKLHVHLIEVFLVNALRLPPADAHDEAYRLAPHFSCRLIKSICDTYGRPSTCPCDEPILEVPGCHGHRGEVGHHG